MQAQLTAGPLISRLTVEGSTGFVGVFSHILLLSFAISVIKTRHFFT